VFENGVLRRLFAPKRDEERGMEKTTQRGAMCSVFLTKYHSGDEAKKAEMSWVCRRYGERRSAYRVLVGKPE
jgi:hypothetical protein